MSITVGGAGKPKPCVYCDAVLPVCVRVVQLGHAHRWLRGDPILDANGRYGLVADRFEDHGDHVAAIVTSSLTRGAK